MPGCRDAPAASPRSSGSEGLSLLYFLSGLGGVEKMDIPKQRREKNGGVLPLVYPKLMEHLGMSQDYLVDKLIEQAMENTARS